MPRPAILFTAAYWAGLATGLLRVGAPSVALFVAAGLGFVSRPLGFVVGGGLLAGRLGGELASAMERERCAALLPAGRLRVRVRVLEPLDSVGGRLTVTPLAGCRGEVTARWLRGRSVEAGSLADVTGRWMPREGMWGRASGTLVISEAHLLELTRGRRTDSGTGSSRPAADCMGRERAS